MRVVSWNIELGRQVDRAAEELTELPELSNVDLLLVQEMDPEGTQRLAERLGMDYRYSAPAEHPMTQLPFGNAVLSRWPMSEVVDVALPHTARVQGQPRCATSTTVTVNGTPIVAYSVHIETVLLGLKRRSDQVSAIAQHAAEVAESRVVIGGDFNSASARSIRAFDSAMGEAGFTRASATIGTTFERFGRPFMLDHLYSRGLRVQESGVVASASASDHRPVWGHFSVT